MLLLLYLLTPAPKCETAPLLAQLPSCRRLDVVALPFKPLADNDLCTSWSSRSFAPQTVKLTTGEPANALVLVPHMAPLFGSVFLRLNGQQANGELANGAPYVAFFSPASTLTVETTASVAQVAWKELIPLACDAPPPKLTPAQPGSPSRARPGQFAKGKGACTSAADCTPNDPCYGTTCDRRTARPKSGSCPDVLDPFYEQGGVCDCVEQRCGAWFSPAH